MSFESGQGSRQGMLFPPLLAPRSRLAVFIIVLLLIIWPTISRAQTYKKVRFVTWPQGAQIFVGDSTLGFSGEDILLARTLFSDPKGKTIPRTFIVKLSGHKEFTLLLRWDQLQEGGLVTDPAGGPLVLTADNFGITLWDYWQYTLLAVTGTLSILIGIYFSMNKKTKKFDQALSVANEAIKKVEEDKDKTLSEIAKLEALADVILEEGKTHFDRVGNYYKLKRLGNGAMGEVYLGCHAQKLSPLGLVALKVILYREKKEESDNPNLEPMFLREAKRAAEIQHPNIVKVLESSQNPGFIAMEYVKGVTLESLIEEIPSGGLFLQPALQYILPLTSGIREIHRQNVIHRDLKPANVMVESGTNRVVVVDFGFARKLDAARESIFQTQVEANGFYEGKGTLMYLPPECLKDMFDNGRAIPENYLNVTLDQYALGVIFYELLAGRHPYRNLQEAKEGTHEDLKSIRPDLPTDLTGTIEKMLATTAAQRFPSMEDVCRYIEDSIRG